MRVAIVVATLLMALIAAAPAFGHGGGLNSQGCHTNHSTGDYHCHRAPARPTTAPPPVQRLCGVASANPGVERWGEYTCRVADGDGCLGYRQYTTVVAAGCAGSQMCCPPRTAAAPPQSFASTPSTPSQARPVASPPPQRSTATQGGSGDLSCGGGCCGGTLFLALALLVGGSKR